MATPASPQKALLSEQASIDAAQRVVDGQTATVADGQEITAVDTTVYALTVVDGVVTDIVVVP